MDEYQQNEIEQRQGSRLRHETLKLVTLTGNNKLSLILFLDGPGGSGKSEVLKHVMVYVKEFYKSLKLPFTRYTILVTAWTGVAATLINGMTTHSALNLGTDITDEHRKLFESVRLIIIDEVSMITVSTLKKINNKLRTLGTAAECYGGFNIVFAGDFRQLEPIESDSICNDYQSIYWMQSLNTYIKINQTVQICE